MKDLEDAYGHELFDYYESKQGIEIIEREDGFISAGTHVGTYFAAFEDWPDHHKEAMQYVHGGNQTSRNHQGLLWGRT